MNLSFKPAESTVIYDHDMTQPASDYVIRLPHPRLRPFVSEYTGYRMAGFEPGVHAGLPSGSLTMIVAFDEALDVEDGHRPGHRSQYWGMIGGLHSAPAKVFHSGFQHGVQLEITPRGANALLGVSPGALARVTEHLDDVAPTFATELVDRLSAAHGWRARWAVIDEIFLRVLNLERELPGELERAWSLMTASHGAASITDLADTAGWSRRHFTKKFSEHYGLTPKTMSRVLRFERAQQMVRLPTRPSLASVAAACGFADQAHMTRDWVEFAGSAPSIWIGDASIPVTEPQQTPSLQDPST